MRKRSKFLNKGGVRWLLAGLVAVLVILLSQGGLLDGSSRAARTEFLQVDVKILNEKPILLGENLLVEVTITSPQPGPREDVLVEVRIHGSQGLVSRRTETRSVELRTSFLTTLLLPQETPDGLYTVLIQVKQDSTGDGLTRLVGEASEDFELGRAPSSVLNTVMAAFPLTGTPALDVIVMVLLLALLFLLFLIIWEHWEHHA